MPFSPPQRTASKQPLPGIPTLLCHQTENEKHDAVRLVVCFLLKATGRKAHPSRRLIFHNEINHQGEKWSHVALGLVWYIFISFFVFYFDKVLLCNPCRPGLFFESGSCYVAQVGLKVILSFQSVRTIGVDGHIQPVLEDGIVSNEL